MRQRHGSTLLTVLVLAAIAGMAMMVFFSTVRQERTRSVKLIQRTRAQYQARRVVMRIAGVVQQRPWSERFFGPGKAPFDSAGSSDGRFADDAEEIAYAGMSYVGTAQQLSARDKEFRIKLRITYPSGSLSVPDYVHVSTWDLRWSEGLLGSLNHAHILGKVESDDDALSEDALDEQLDVIRDTARSPKQDREVAGSPAEPWIDHVRDFEKNSGPIQVAAAGGDPFTGSPLPPYVDGQSAPGSPDPLDPVRKAIADATSGTASSPPQTGTADLTKVQELNCPECNCGGQLSCPCGCAGPCPVMQRAENWITKTTTSPTGEAIVVKECNYVSCCGLVSSDGVRRCPLAAPDAKPAPPISIPALPTW